MCNCLKRTEVETSHNTEMLKIFLFFILFSAKERQDHPTQKMSSQAFAHLHHISLVVYSSLCTQTNLWLTYSGQTGGWSESTLILTNQSQSKITRLIRVDQSQASKLVTEDRRTDGQRKK